MRRDRRETRQGAVSKQCPARPGDHPVRRGLRRRHAAHRRPVHARDGVVRQRPVDAAQLPRRDPGAGRHPAGRLGVPAALRRPRHPDARRRAERAGGDEPGGAEGQHRRPAARRGPHRQHRRVHQAQPGQGRLRGQPARGRLAGGVRRAPGPADLDDGRGAQGLRHGQEGRRAGQEHVRARACCPGSTTGRPRARWRSCETKFAKKPDDPGGEHRRVPGRLELRRDHRGLRGLVRGQARGDARRARTATSPATWRWPTAWSPPASAAGLPLFLGSYPITPAVGHPARAEQAQALRRRAPSRPRTRSPASARRWARRSAARWASPPPPGRAWR